MNKKKKKIFIISACLLFLIPLILIGFVLYEVTLDASTRIQRGAIDRIIASESPVYYDDGETPIGVFFEKTHRKYIHFSEIPKVFIKALIAAEDGNFFSHKGVDLKAALRALIANIKSGKVVQGGSTISQQTAKNIFRREKRSYGAKLRELVQAFLLERKYTKEEILEMYINQFFVTGYGKGLGIAAQCFFDKEAKNLDLVEAAFIAGSVKGPNRYNPFIKKSEAERNHARELARQRKDYVLKNMFKLNFITRDQYLKAKEMTVPFKEGKITYRLNVILDYIREQLESDYFRSVLDEQGVNNTAASGISIYTSINREIQKAALTSLRTHLPLMDVKLNGYSALQIPDMSRDLFKKGSKKQSSLPFMAQITHIDTDTDHCRLVVSWGRSGGIINFEGIKPMAQAWLKWKLGNSVVLDKKYVRMFLKNFHVGDTVPVQMIPLSGGTGETRMMLSRIPELEGGVIVLQKGMVKAMVGGFLDRFFNRAVDAKRQLGSIFKPIVYTAALQLKWNSLDPLRNTRDMFQFENTFYLPHPDHEPKSETVSMVWAGAKSENLATVWLLYHLTDHLNMSEFRQVMRMVDLDRNKGESYLEYKKRIRDHLGVVVNTEALKEAAFKKSVKEITSDIIFGGHEEILNNLKRLHFNLDRRRFNPENPEERSILRFSFQRLHALNMNMKTGYQATAELLNQQQDNMSPEENSILLESLRNLYRTEDEEKLEKIIYTENPESLSPSPLVPLTLEWMRNRSLPIKTGEVWIDGLFTSETLDLIQKNITGNLRTLSTYKRYDPEVLFWARDFRTLVNLSYVVYLSKQMGISSRLAPVLSFPLGPNAISISEAALAYQTIMTGRIYPIAPDENLSMIPMITKIVDRDGDILWEFRPKPVKVLSGRVSGLVSEILRKVMETGTGQKAKDEVSVYGIPIPSFGKTGTANRFTNSSFVGFIPGSNEDTGQLDIQEGYVIASYVGYDDNRPMKAQHLAIYGASGALPLWIDTAKAIADAGEYEKNIEPADLAFDPVSSLLSQFGNFHYIPVSPLSGLPVTHSDGIPATQRIDVLADVEERGDMLELKRDFKPIAGGFE